MQQKQPFFCTAFRFYVNFHRAGIDFLRFVQLFQLPLLAVIGAAPAENVRRERPIDGDIVILLGGRTGRDGCGKREASGLRNSLCSFLSSGALPFCTSAPQLSRDSSVCDFDEPVAERCPEEIRWAGRYGIGNQRISGENGCCCGVSFFSAETLFTIA